MWVFVVRWLVRSFVLDHIGELIATLTMALATLILTVGWSLGVIAQPGGIYWLAAQAPAEVQAAHPLGAPINATPTSIVLGSPPPAAPAPGLTGLPGVPSGIVAAAERWLGVRYQWGGCSHQGVDCSCYMVNIFAEFGIHLPRTTVEQIRWAIPITRAEATVGDLVFFDGTCSDCGPNPTHVGLVIDPARNLMIDAGDPVRIEPIFNNHNPRFGRVH